MVKAVLSKASAPFSSSETSFGSAFRDGLIGGAVLFFLLIVWMFLRGPDTAEKIQPLIPFKSVKIEITETAAQDIADEPGAPSQRTLPGGREIVPLPPVPVEGLSETGNGRTLPIVRIQDDMTAFQAYKAPFAAAPGKNKVSLVIMDFGLSSKLAQSMLDNLPPEISLVLSPYADDPARWGTAARAYGHEFWMALPMESKGLTDSGPDAIMKNASFENNEARVLDVLATTPGYVGVVTAKNHAIAAQDVAASPVLKQIFGRGLAIAESNPEIAAFGLSQAMEHGYPYVQNNFWIDEALDPASIDRALAAVEQQAGAKGKAVVFFHPYPLVIQRVQAWAEGADKRGIQLAPLSAMAQ